MLRKIQPLLLCLLSACLLTLSFPQHDLFLLAWIALAPLIFISRQISPAKSLWFGFLSGLFFYSFMFHWLRHVTLLGAILIAIYCSLYFALFLWGINRFKTNHAVVDCLFGGSWWVVLEYLRSNVCSGFGWASLGHSQYLNIPLLQVAEFGGVYILSFLIVYINIAIVSVCIKSSFKNVLNLLVLFALILSFSIWGLMRLSNLENNKVSDFKVAIVQGNIPQELKWNQMLWPTIMKKYHRLTEEAIKLNPDIIIWPETAFPGFIGSDDAALEGVVDQVAQSKIPLLFGSVVRTKEHYYNSAQMIDKNGSFYAPYYKMHLVPFGEYVPMRRFFPFFADLIPIADFTPGNHHITFPWNGFKLAVLICFEDTVDYLSRRMVLSGAHVLINLTNDAWFEDTKQPYLHLQTAVFRSVENRRAMIRATNTGVSAYISPEGIITHYLEDISGRRTYIDGVTTQQVPLMKGKTFYTRFGNVFVVFCALGVLGGLYLRRWT